jgi:2-hydroxychromene-2-carboxylate isomerase
MIRDLGKHAARRLQSLAVGAYLGVARERESGGLVDRVAAPLQRRHATFFFDASDPYSFLLVQKLPALLTRYGVESELVVVSPPLPDVRPGAAQNDAYALRDARLLAQYYDLSFPADPVLPPPALVTQAQAVLLRPRSAGAQCAAARAVCDALWRGDATVLAALEAELGSVSARDVPGLLRVNDTILRDRGHYQGGMLRYRGIWYWGVDRLCHLEARLRREGRDTEPGAPDLVGMRPSALRPAATEHADALICYVSVRSPYSYIGLERAAHLTLGHAVELDVRPILPMRMRGVPVPRVKELYIARDAAREAARHGIPFGRICDPLGPGVERTMAMFVHATEQGRGVEFMRAVMRAVWAEGQDVTSDRGMAHAVERAGLSWRRARAALTNQRWRELVARNLAELQALGLWGVPTFQLGPLAVWGQDRLPILEDILHRQP